MVITPGVIVTPGELFLYGLAIVADLGLLAVVGLGILFFFYSFVAPPTPEATPELEEGDTA